jgi:aspartate-semialdehyde dehydrogenase
LYLETAEPVRPEALAQVLEGERIRLRRPSQHAPSQVEAAGSSDILVDAITPDPARREGIWIWAVADNVCLAALNAVEIAESLVNSGKLRSGQPTHKQ